MPGSSLWLVPPPSHPLHAIITKLITTILPSQFPSEAGGLSDTDNKNETPNPINFAAHMTLTSEILPSTYLNGTTTPDLSKPPSEEEKQAAQAWLDSLPLPPAEKVHVRLGKVDTQDVFFRRCFIRVGYEGVQTIVGVARQCAVTRSGGDSISQGTEEWLKWWKEAYGPHVSLIYGSTPITEEMLAQISKTVEEAGAVLGASALTNEPGAGWEGGVVWLVPTDRSIPEWMPIATRTLV